MTDVAPPSSGKGHRDENFPVASLLIKPTLRPAILAFYRFSRAADDVADHPSCSESKKLMLLDRLEAGLSGDPAGAPEGLALGKELRNRRLSSDHALDLLKAFRLDVTKSHYADWNDLMEYCRYSAAPVGRFVLDLHGERQSLWPMNDALCSALQVINHLQDCAEDYRRLRRVYLPRDLLAQNSVPVEALGEARASAGLRSSISTAACLTKALLEKARPFSTCIDDFRLSLEVGVIQSLADDLSARLTRHDPLSERVHHGGIETAIFALRGLLRGGFDRTIRAMRLKTLDCDGAT